MKPSGCAAVVLFLGGVFNLNSLSVIDLGWCLWVSSFSLPSLIRTSAMGCKALISRSYLITSANKVTLTGTRGQDLGLDSVVALWEAQLLRSLAAHHHRRLRGGVSGRSVPSEPWEQGLPCL